MQEILKLELGYGHDGGHGYSEVIIANTNASAKLIGVEEAMVGDRTFFECFLSGRK